jgi:DNA-binding response OmpR family regulator
MVKVMLIDDDENILSLLDTFLELEGYQTVQFGAGLSLSDQEIYQAIKNQHPDLLMMDVHLNQVNGINGFDLLERLREDPELSHMHILMSSGIDFSDKSKQYGADGFVLKPFMPDELLGQIKNALGHR